MPCNSQWNYSYKVELACVSANHIMRYSILQLKITELHEKEHKAMKSCNGPLDDNYEYKQSKSILPPMKDDRGSVSFLPTLSV